MKRPKTYILDEEEHLENLRKIIKRDFFDGAGQPQEPAVKLRLNDYLANFKSDQNQIFTELVKAHDQDWKEKNKWMQRCGQLMLQSGGQSKLYRNMISKGQELKAIDYGKVKQDPKNAIFFSPSRETKSYLDPANLEAKQVLYDNCRLDEDPKEKTYRLRKLPRDPNLEQILDTPMLEGKEILRDAADGEYSLKRAPSPEPEDIPIMTWGQVACTPVRLDRSVYRMAETPRRDLLLDELNSKMTKEKMIKKNRKEQMKMKILSSVRAGSSVRKVSVKRFDSTKRTGAKIEDDSRLDGLLRR